MPTRRQLLKQGASLSGLLWVAPVTRSIGLTHALAEDTSGPCTTYCIKFEFTGVDDTSLVGEWLPLGNGQGNVFTCPSRASNATPSADLLAGFEIVEATSSRTSSVTIRFPEGCGLAETDSSPDELAYGNVAVKCGQSGRNVQQLEVDPVTREIEVAACSDDSDEPDVSSKNAISHIELIVRCC